MGAPTAAGLRIQPHHLATLSWVGLAVAVGAFIPLSGDLRLQSKAIFVAAISGALTFAIIPNRRLALVCAWVISHPLSLEKVFPVFAPAYEGLMGTSVIISGSDLVLYALTCWLFFERVTESRPVFFWSKPATPWLMLSVWAAVVFVVTQPTATGFIQVVHYFKMLLFLVVFSSAIRTRQELITVILAGGAAVLFQALIVFWAYGTKQKVGFSSKVAGEAMMTFSAGGGEALTRATGTVGHVNQQAMFHVFFTLPLIGLFMVKNWIWRVAIAAVIALSFTAVILTFSRASWLAIIAALGIVLFVATKSGRMNRMGWLAVGLGGLVAIAGIGAFSGKIITRLTKGDDGATSSRLRMVDLAIEHFTTNLVTGVGPGNFVNARLASTGPITRARNVWLPRGYDYRPRYLAGLELYEVEIQDKWYYMLGVVHNKVLLVMAELGLVGITLFAFYQWKVYRLTLSLLRSQDRLIWWIGLGLLAAFWATQLEFMFELFYDDKTVLLPLFVNALVIAAVRIVALENSAASSGKVLT